MNRDNLTPPVGHVALIGNFPPRKCGIATFTADLREALATTDGDLKISTVAVTDEGQNHAYPPAVGYEISQHEADDYAAAADHINALNPDAVSIQHEFGIFGGQAGEYLLKLTERLRAPIVTTLHTVLVDPTPDQRRVMEHLAEHSARLVVMTEMGRTILTRDWSFPEEKIAVIPHGIPDVPFLDPAFQKHNFGLDGRKVALTFGLLSPNKGIENMIDALPDLARTHPDLVYVVLGATHPHLVAREGEAYREKLQAQADALGVTDHLMFVNEYVDAPVLKDWLSAADIYVTPYLNEAQITSGTLSYAVGLGKAVVSTPYWHARELLADDVGALVPFGDPKALASTIGDLLTDNGRRDRLRAFAYDAGRQMIWPVVGRAYLDLLAEARSGGRTLAPVSNLRIGRRAPLVSTLAAVDRMTDGCGMLQHSRSTIPDRRHGYCLDDNARAMMLAVELKAEGIETERATRIADTCAAFVDSAWDEGRAAFRNFMGYQRNWLEDTGSEDSHGRAVWSLGRVVASTDDHGLKLWATGLADRVIPASAHLSSPRATAFTTLGLIGWLTVYPGHRPARHLLDTFAAQLHALLREQRRPDWLWFEPVLAYDNARLPEALIRAGQWLDKDDMIRDGIAALDWLAELQTDTDGHFRPVGTESFGRLYSRPLPFDQQPVDAWAMIEASTAAFDATGDDRWQRYAEAAFDWFNGRNDLGLRLATPNGGCYDGLQVDRVNLNQGAESILAFQFSVRSIRQLQRLAHGRSERVVARAGQ
ncbi:glycosyltransferase family 4 protein [Pleomorphomonas sp. NRK KF1]|uniref:glycosyltransferase family 4 protein n=1 Tax=Pleomorphomonas sp. NRK KF1 TaxID=2943000 RepID=UPI0020434FA1|nr:glycosyltransferase family 4 protein [Pleomorphomonas sp. NRK KF1]MCM5552790.1 glycosyltransferase family 4 protein [Pleomorphomonas sp. NRK KF1]